MTDTLWGVVVGAAITAVLPAATLLFEYAKWRRELRLARLREKRDRLERMFRDAIEPLAEAFESGTWRSDQVIELLTHAPESVRNAMNAANEQIMGGRDAMDAETLGDRGRQCFQDIIGAMHKELAAIDRDIDALVG